MKTIMECEFGSRAYGLANSGSDSDLMAVAIEPPEYVTGLLEAKSKQANTAEEGEKSGADDTDKIIHPLRKFAGLAAKGNPTVLTAFFVPHYTVMTDHFANLILHREAFVSKRAGSAHVGYMESQLRALKGLRHKKVKRPELEEEFGYDTKFAYHAVRLGLQGIELMKHGKYTLPFEGEEREMLLSIRNGEKDKGEAIELIEKYSRVLKDTMSETDQPKDPDLQRINGLLHKAYTTEWTRVEYASQ